MTRKRRLGVVVSLIAVLALAAGGCSYGVYRWWRGPDLRLRDGTRHAAVLHTESCPDGRQEWFVNLDGPTRSTFQSNSYTWTNAAPVPASLTADGTNGTLLIVHDWGQPAAYFEAKGIRLPMDGGSEYQHGPTSKYAC
jgi:hypothetical protein